MEETMIEIDGCLWFYSWDKKQIFGPFEGTIAGRKIAEKMLDTYDYEIVELNENTNYGPNSFVALTDRYNQHVVDEEMKLRWVDVEETS